MQDMTLYPLLQSKFPIIHQVSRYDTSIFLLYKTWLYEAANQVLLSLISAGQRIMHIATEVLHKFFSCPRLHL